MTTGTNQFTWLQVAVKYDFKEYQHFFPECSEKQSAY